MISHGCKVVNRTEHCMLLCSHNRSFVTCFSWWYTHPACSSVSQTGRHVCWSNVRMWADLFPLHLWSTDLVGVQVDHLKEKDNFALLEQARIIYSAGFFLTASAESMLTAAKHAAANNKIYCVNISAPFLLQVVPSLCAWCTHENMCIHMKMHTSFVLALLLLHWHNARKNVD